MLVAPVAGSQVARVVGSLMVERMVVAAEGAME